MNIAGGFYYKNDWFSESVCPTKFDTSADGDLLGAKEIGEHQVTMKDVVAITSNNSWSSKQGMIVVIFCVVDRWVTFEHLFGTHGRESNN